MFPVHQGSSSQSKRKERSDFDAVMYDLDRPITSFTSLLMEDDHLDGNRFPQQIGRIINSHSDNLQRSLVAAQSSEISAIQHRAEEKMNNLDKEIAKLLQVNNISEERTAHFNFQCQFWKNEVQKMEGLRKELSEMLRIAKLQRVEEDEESSYVDSERGEVSTWQMCKACGKGVGAVMVWPCRHVSICVTCDATVKACPICLTAKTASVQVSLP